MMKVTVLYGHPTSSEEFEKYYKDTHLPLVAKMEGMARSELTKFIDGPDGGKPAFYRMAELYFATEKQMDETMGSPEGQAAVADISQFATGGVTVVVGSTQE